MPYPHRTFISETHSLKTLVNLFLDVGMVIQYVGRFGERTGTRVTERAHLQPFPFGKGKVPGSRQQRIPGADRLQREATAPEGLEVPELYAEPLGGQARGNLVVEVSDWYGATKK